MTYTTTIAAHAIEPLDPLPPGRIAMWLIITADLMFFVGLIGAFLVLRAGNTALFADHAKGLDRPIGEAELTTLLLSSAMMFVAGRMVRAGSYKRAGLALLATLLLGASFIGERAVEYLGALNHHTIVFRQHSTDPLMVYDGQIDWWNGTTTGEHVVAGYAAILPTDFDALKISAADVAQLSTPRQAHEFQLIGEPLEDIPYGPGKNIFYAIWYTLTGAHLVHILAAMIAVAVVLVQLLKGKIDAQHVEYVGAFWNFVVVVGVVLFPLIYLW